jgi:hypothetical protein
MAKAAGMDELILEAMERALADPSPRKLHGTKTNPGIFLSSTAPAKTAAQRCLEQGLIEQVAEQKSKTKAVPLYGITPAGITYLLERDPARQLLAATRDGVERLAQATAEWQQTLVQVQDQVSRLRQVVQDAAGRVRPPDLTGLLAGLQQARVAIPAAAPQTMVSPRPAADGVSPDVSAELLRYLQQHKRQSPLRPVELPQLFRVARSRQPSLTLGQFHDVLRRLAEAGQLRLSPFTQAMYQLPEPECAMIVGREVMYYAECV